MIHENKRRSSVRMKMLSVDDTLLKQGSDFGDWPRGADHTILRNSCPKCGSDVLCAYADMNRVDFLDTYHHICMNTACDFMEKKCEYAVGMGAREESGPSPCPFCGRTLR